jgi:hypothetical protein
MGSLLRDRVHPTSVGWFSNESLAWTDERDHATGALLRTVDFDHVPGCSVVAARRATIDRLIAARYGTDRAGRRLLSELRLRGLATREAANAFLPEFIAAHNRRFARAPAAPRGLWRRPPPDLDLLLSCRYTRVVARDHSVRVGTRVILLPRHPRGRSWAGYRVDVRELLTGELFVLYHGMPLARASLARPLYPPTPRLSLGCPAPPKPPHHPHARSGAPPGHVHPIPPLRASQRYASVAPILVPPFQRAAHPMRGRHFHGTVTTTFSLDSDSSVTCRMK